MKKVVSIDTVKSFLPVTFTRLQILSTLHSTLRTGHLFLGLLQLLGGRKS
jgi:hypothetical protein